MKTTKRIEEKVTLDPGETSGAPVIKLSVDYDDGTHPQSVHIDEDGTRVILSVEAVMRVAAAIRRTDWLPEGVSVCPDLGVVTLSHSCLACRPLRSAEAAR